MQIKKFLKEYSAYIAWIIAFTAMLGSLYFSNIRGFAPCVLCWYQRIVLYPLVLIIPIGIMKKDKHIASYVLPLTIIGIGISIYHNLLYYNILPESAGPCLTGVSCTTKFIEYFGFLTIPLLSLLALTAITILMIINKKYHE